MERPDYLIRGEAARLFPVLSTTSKEGRTASVFLACLSKIDELATVLMSSVGKHMGKRSQLEAYTEVVFRADKSDVQDRPDGLIVIKNGSNQWRALVEAKVGRAQLTAQQIEKYRVIAKNNGVDCVITISNQFAATAMNHPVAEVRKSRSKVPVFHWSWMFILTTTDLLLNKNEIPNEDQNLLLDELRRFLRHESAGIKGFERMPQEWGELNRLISAGGKIPLKSPETAAVIEAWHQETKDLSLILNRQTETSVHEKIARKHIRDPAGRDRDEIRELSEQNQLHTVLHIPNAAAPLDVIADLSRRTIDVGMTLRAPEDRVSSRARLNWLLRQVKSEHPEDIIIRLNWPGSSSMTQYSIVDLNQDPGLCHQGKEGLQVKSFHIFMSRRIGAKFTQQSNFIRELEDLVPLFYREIGQNFAEWRMPAPKIKAEKIQTEEHPADELNEEP